MSTKWTRNKCDFEIAWERSCEKWNEMCRENEAKRVVPEYVSYEDRLKAIDRKYNSTERV